MSDIREGQPVGSESRGEILARLRPTDHEHVRAVDPQPRPDGLDGSGGSGDESRIDGLPDDADTRAAARRSAPVRQRRTG